MRKTIRLSICLAIVLWSCVPTPGQARASCPSYSEARAAYPGKHLRWYGKAHCWTRADVVRVAADITAARRPAAAARPVAVDSIEENKTILMPSLMAAPANLSAEYLDAHSFLFAPVLLDLDIVQRHSFKPWNERIAR